MSDTEAMVGRLAVARDLIGREKLDVSAALAMLNTLPATLSPDALHAVDHAKRAVAAAPGGDHRHEAVARYMIARVIAALERAMLDGPR